MRLTVVAIACVFLAPGITPGGVAVAGKNGSHVVVREGVKHIVNPAVGTGSAGTLTTTRLWQCGGEGDEFVFGTIGGVVRDRRGNTYLLDDQMNVIHVIAPDGAYKGTVGREGEGPAEFRRASGLVLLSDSVLCVTQAVPARAVRMSITGRALDDYPLSHDLASAYLNGCALVNGRLAVKVGRMTRGKTFVELQTAFGLLDEGGAVGATYWERSQKADFANMTFDERADAEPVWAFSGDGRLFINSDWARYDVAVMDPGKKAEYVIERAYESLPRSSGVLEAIEKQKQSGKMSPDTKISATVRDIVRLFPRQDGSLWVLSSRGDGQIPDDVVAVFDEFDRSGVFTRSVTIRGARRPHLDDFFLVDDDVFVIMNAGEGSAADAASGGGGEIEVVCLSLADAR